MNLLRALLITLVCCLVTTAAAEAVDLWTPPLFIDASTNIECKVRNITTFARAMRVMIVNASGVVVSEFNAGVSPFGTFSGLTFAGPGYFSCRFTVPSKSYVRAAAAIYRPGTNDVDIVVVPAE